MSECTKHQRNPCNAETLVLVCEWYNITKDTSDVPVLQGHYTMLFILMADRLSSHLQLYLLP